MYFEININIAMAERFFNLLQCVLKLMAENKLKKDIDDTLIEKLLTLFQNCRLQSSDEHQEVIIVDGKSNQGSCFDFIKELLKRTDALYFIEKIVASVSLKDENNSIMIKSFFIRLLGLVHEKTDKVSDYENLLPLLKHPNGIIISNHNPSIQDALLFCLSCITKKYDGALWFMNQNLKDFVISCFNSSSYYVRKSSINFFITFILQWTSFLSNIEQKKTEELNLEAFIKIFLSFVIDHIHFYRNSEEIVFAECCIVILKQLLESENSECVMRNIANLSQSISDCFNNLSEEAEFNKKLTDLFLTIHFKFSLPMESINDVIKCLIVKDIKLGMDLASSFARKAWSKQTYTNEVKFFMLPIYILLNEPLEDCESFFAYNADATYCIVLKKMEEKFACKLLFSSSLLALVKIVPQLNLSFQRHIGLEMLKVIKCCNPCHKWLYSVLEDRLVHHSLIDFYSALLSDDVYPSLVYEKSDLVFQNILEHLKKPSSDSNFLSQLLLLMKNILNLHKKYEFDLEENEKNDLTQILCRTLLDTRESVVDSAIHLSGEIIKNIAWRDKISQQGIHSIIWDIAIQGNFDGTTRSTALKVIIDSCQEEWCLKEMKSLKNLTEIDIAKKLFCLNYDPDFFLQREALSCLYLWIKSRWNELPPTCIDYLYVALVSAVKSLDLELKLTSLDIWKWLLENKHTISVISPSLNIKDYAHYLATSGFGLSMILALEDYDQAVQYKAASILHELKIMLISYGSTFDSLQLESITEDEAQKCISSENLMEPVSKEERDKGIDIVMELSTFEQIAKICHPISNVSDFKEGHFLKERTCTVSAFWTCLWSKNVNSIIESVKEASADTMYGESILRDIISAGMHDSNKGIPDCY